MARIRSMDASAWSACADVLLMLRRIPHSKGAARKFRLFACACVRSVADQLHSFEAAVVTDAEKFADGEMRRYEMERRRLTEDQYWSHLDGPTTAAADRLVAHAARSTIIYTSRSAAVAVVHFVRLVTANAEPAGRATRVVDLADLLRGVVFNPFAPAPAVHRSEDAVRLAGELYDKREDEALRLVLADSQEEADCREAAELLRSGPFYRGNWAVDMILDKPKKRPRRKGVPRGTGST